MLTGTCHCGTVGFELNQIPAFLVDCNCSLCRRLGALWGHIPVDSVRIVAAKGATHTYIQGSQSLAVHSCVNCGCVTHWENLQAEAEKMAVNFRMCNPDTLRGFQVRKLDGADTWKYLD